MIVWLLFLAIIIILIIVMHVLTLLCNANRLPANFYDLCTICNVAGIVFQVNNNIHNNIM